RHAVSIAQVAASHDRHDQGCRRDPRTLCNPLCHGAIPYLHAFDEAHELRVMQIGFGRRNWIFFFGTSLARGRWAMLEIGVIEKRQIRWIRWRRIGKPFTL